jgi:hypothetical protein
VAAISAFIMKQTGVLVLASASIHALEQMRSSTVLDLPAAQRRDAVARRHRRAVGPLEAGAQLEGVGFAVLRDVETPDHLGLRVEIAVDAKQRVVHHGAVVGRHVLCRPDRVKNRQVAMRHHAHLPCRPGLGPRHMGTNAGQGRRSHTRR